MRCVSGLTHSLKKNYFWLECIVEKGRQNYRLVVWANFKWNSWGFLCTCMWGIIVPQSTLSQCSISCDVHCSIGSTVEVALLMWFIIPLTAGLCTLSLTYPCMKKLRGLCVWSEVTCPPSRKLFFQILIKTSLQWGELPSSSRITYRCR